MFGKRGNDDGSRGDAGIPSVAAPPPVGEPSGSAAAYARPAAPRSAPTRARRHAQAPVEAPPLAAEPRKQQRERSETYYDTK